jgi:hypothetical protein
MKSNFYILIIFLVFVVSCQNNKKVDEINQNEQQNQEETKTEWIETIEPDILKKVLPDTLFDFKLAPFSEFSSEEHDRIIHTAKYQFGYEKDQEKRSVIIDITDYGNIDEVPFSHIYDEPPKEVNVITDTLKTENYKGYSIWSPVDNTGRTNVIIDDRFVIKVRSSANDTISNFLKSIINKIDYKKLEELKKKQR